MSKKIIIFLAVFLVSLNVLAWQEVFAFNKPKYLEINFLSVGQGDSAFIETPEGHQILIDGGPNSEILEKLNYLMPFWDKSIDLVILTHPEKDHMTGLLDVLQRYKVDYFLWTGVVKNDAENRKLAFLLQKASSGDSALAYLSGSYNKTKVITAKAGEKLKAGRVSMDIIYPFYDMNGQEPKNTNDSSIVLRLVFGESSFIFTGDISSKAEKEIVNSGKNILSDVLKVGHHGSKYSTSDLFLENVKPEIAVIEVGKNSYGHPTPEVLQRLENFGIKIFRTDVDGDVELVSNGNNIYIK